MASPTAVYSSRVDNSTANAVCDITPPSLADDDVLYAIVEQAAVTDPPTLSGWSELFGVNHSGGRSTLLRKVIVTASGEPSSYAFAWTGNTRNSGFIIRARGADTTTPEAGSGVAGPTVSANPDPPSVNPGSSDTYLSLTLYGMEGKVRLVTVFPTGYTDPSVDGGTSGAGSQATHASVGGSHREYTGQTENPSAYTIDASDSWNVFTIIVAPAVVGGQTIAVGTLAQIDALIASSPIKIAPIGTLAEAESLITSSPTKVASVGVLAETEALIAAAPVKLVPVGVLAETDSLLLVPAVKPIITAVGILAEIEFLLAAVAAKFANIGTLVETDSLLPVLPYKTVNVGTLAEIDTLVTVLVVQPGGQDIAITTLATIDGLAAVQPVKAANIGTLAELETLLTISGLKTVNVGTLTEIEALLAISGLKTYDVGTLAEIESLLIAGGLKTAAIGTLSETNLLIAVALVQGAPFALLMRVVSDQYDRTQTSTEYDATQDSLVEGRVVN